MSRSPQIVIHIAEAPEIKFSNPNAMPLCAALGSEERRLSTFEDPERIEEARAICGRCAVVETCTNRLNDPEDLWGFEKPEGISVERVVVAGLTKHEFIARDPESQNDVMHLGEAALHFDDVA